MPGSARLRDCDVLREITRKQAEGNRLYGAICAAPAVTLLPWGLLKKKKVLCLYELNSCGNLKKRSIFIHDSCKDFNAVSQLEITLDMMFKLYTEKNICTVSAL